MFSSLRTQGAIGVPSTVKIAVRNASSKRTPPRADKRIPVQLLKDFPNVGVRGEIVKVLPSVMRNYLHMNNGAAYLIKGKEGPRIPVVDRSVYLAQQEKIKQRDGEIKAAKKKEEAEKLAKETKASTTALSVDELSNLFQNIKKNKKISETTTESETTTATSTAEAFADEYFFTSLDVSQSIPETYTLNLSGSIILPITKEFLVSQFYNTAGLEIPVSALKLISKDGEVVAEVIAPGTYTISIEVPNEREQVKRTLVVQ